MKHDILTALHEKAREAINDAILKVLSSGDLVVLGMLGIDGRKEMLDVFIEECENIIKEISDGT